MSLGTLLCAARRRSVPAGTWQTCASASLDANGFAGFQGSTIRQIINAAGLSVSGSEVRLTFEADTTRSWNMTEVYIGQQGAGNPYGFLTTPTPITFGGGNAGFSLTSGQSILSDEITFTFDATKNHVIGMDWVNTGTLGCRSLNSKTNWNPWSKAADDAQTVGATGYTDRIGLGAVAGINLIEVFGP